MLVCNYNPQIRNGCSQTFGPTIMHKCSVNRLFRISFVLYCQRKDAEHKAKYSEANRTCIHISVLPDESVKVICFAECQLTSSTLSFLMNFEQCILRQLVLCLWAYLTKDLSQDDLYTLHNIVNSINYCSILCLHYTYILNSLHTDLLDCHNKIIRMRRAVRYLRFNGV